jgi:hypothetical protein
MVALHQIREAGFDVALVDGWIEISPADRLTQNQRDFLKSHKAEIISELQAEQISRTHAEQIARAYLTAIGETDQAIIEEVMRQCRHSAEALAYYAAQVDRQAGMHQADRQHGTGSEQAGRVQADTCQTCRHWQPFNSHGRGAGTCGAGVPGGGVCRWGNTVHQCGEYEAQ